MVNDVVTAGRLTVMMPVIKQNTGIERFFNDPVGNMLVAKILHRKVVSTGMKLLYNKDGKRMKPIAQMIMRKGCARLAAGESPEAIVRDLEAQLRLVIP